MRVVAHEFDPLLVLGPGWIDDVAVALDDAQQLENFRMNRGLSEGRYQPEQDDVTGRKLSSASISWMASLVARPSLSYHLCSCWEFAFEVKTVERASGWSGGGEKGGMSAFMGWVGMVAAGLTRSSESLRGASAMHASSV